VPILGDFAIFQNDDEIGIFGGRNPVGDDEGGGAFFQFLQVLADREIGLGVDGGKGIIEDENRGIRKDGAGDRNPLFLPARERHAFFADRSVIAIFEIDDGVMDIGDPGGPDNLVLAGFLIGHQDVFADRFAEKEGILQDRDDVAAEIGFLDVFEFDPIDLIEPEV
jgi:hypothetical protein